MYGLRAGRGQISFTAEAQGRKGTLTKVLVSLGATLRLGASAVKTNDGASCGLNGLRGLSSHTFLQSIGWRICIYSPKREFITR